jgi:SNF2 family DNA or RNA helicase
LLLTGTPLSNNLRELWSLLKFIMPNLFIDESLFDDIQNSSDQLQGTEEEKFAYQCKIAATFHQIIEPFFKRRTKKNLELGLPQKIEKTLFVPLSSLQLQCYRNFLKYGNVAGPCTYSSFNIMTPRKICLHPYLFGSIR